MIFLGKISSPFCYSKLAGLLIIYIIAKYISFLPIVFLGIIIASLYTLYNLIMSIYIFKVEPYLVIGMNASNLFWNIMIFINLSEFILKLLVM
jgi:hypothetical protein